MTRVRFSKIYARIVVLSMCLSIGYGFFGNELFPTDRRPGTYRMVQRGWLLEEKMVVRAANETREKDEGTNKTCADRSINDFPADLFTYEQRRHGAVMLHAFLGFYCFLLTAFVCHDYLLPSVDRICVQMNISTDVAGATFLAMASSFPEMFVNVIGTFLTESDLGTGTVVGSAVFDTFATPACGALIAVRAIPLEWQVLSRDCTMYVISVVTLVIIMWDLRIRWYEATILLLLLCSYLMLLLCGKGIALGCRKIVRFNSDNAIKLSNVSTIENSTVDGSYKPRPRNDAVVADRRGDLTVGKLENQQNVAGNDEKVVVVVVAAANPETPLGHSPSEYLFAWPRERSATEKCWFTLVWPLKFLLFITIPDARAERLKHWYPLTFVMSMIWIAIISYLLSWMMTTVGDTIGIPDSIMGLTFLAAGGNMPEVASIVILARQGDGNMAMSNTLGANILDILLGLGLPWTIRCLTTGRDVMIVSTALSYSVLSIVACIAILYGVLAFFGFKLNKKVGLICLLLYAIFVVFACLVELNVFFFVNFPMCDY
ncbi:unnamed protein product [Xylocopa violacea]|uniref:Sodium/calcium exchanger membrane region domain-containing protein n=1 Tax=Xylocopa violacea TaxID=135666 RepID=A0ABP1P0G8_XYLVO